MPQKCPNERSAFGGGGGNGVRRQGGILDCGCRQPRSPRRRSSPHVVDVVLGFLQAHASRLPKSVARILSACSVVVQTEPFPACVLFSDRIRFRYHAISKGMWRSDHVANFG